MHVLLRAFTAIRTGNASWLKVSKYLSNANYFTADTATVDYYELYDLQADPHELNNIYGKPETKGVFKTLKKQLDNYRKTLKVDEY